MNTQGPNSSIQMHVDVAKLLQSELVQLSFSIPADEKDSGFFGPGTRQAVEDFQKRNGLNITGEPDEATTALISAQVDGLQPVVRGRVSQTNGDPVSSAQVRLFRKQL